ncbi:hypothetical protein RJ639_047503 [Escallonia herrerae]|uniref:Reverse transcriptase Ty1/copia-type domain-containing protein n=1 Tax=Escallonia herrerae TaxID=1293975 RepID=A0AA88W808_9ASTE|nr:hypothetical protein RJ639_047503 [Escallonia herrerae]
MASTLHLAMEFALPRKPVWFVAIEDHIDEKKLQQAEPVEELILVPFPISIPTQPQDSVFFTDHNAAKHTTKYFSMRHHCLRVSTRLTRLGLQNSSRLTSSQPKLCVDHQRLCRKIGTDHFPQDCPRNLEKWSKNTSSTSAPLKSRIQYRFKPPSNFAAAADDVLNDSSSSALSVNDVAEIVKQIMSDFGTPSSSALSVTSGSDFDGIPILKQDLNHHFEMKDLGTLSYYLGLEVSTASDGYYLSQAKYASNLLSRAGLTDSKTASTPFEPNEMSCEYLEEIDPKLLDDTSVSLGHVQDLYPEDIRHNMIVLADCMVELLSTSSKSPLESSSQLG